ELWNYAMVGAGHAAYTGRFHELARIVPHLIFGALTDEAVRNGSINKVEKRGNMGEPSKDKNGRDDNKRTRTGNAFASTANPIGRENTSTWPKCTTCNSYHAPRGPCCTCFNYNRPSHLAKDCRGLPRNVNPVNARNPTVRAYYKCGSTDHVRSACPRLNRAQVLEENRPNQVAANNEGQGHGNQGNQARGRAFMLGAKEACQDPNIVTGIEPSELGFRYEIEIASGYGIIYHEKVVRIPLPDGKVLRVLGKRPDEKAGILMSVKASDKKQEEIVVVRDFPKVFRDDLSRLPPLWEIKFRIELIPKAVPIAKSPCHLAPSELEELFIENFSKIAKSLTILTQKGKTFDWGKEQGLAFQTLKDKLCNTHVLALLDRPEDFVRRWIELFSDYDCQIRYYPGKENVVADALSRKERVKPKRGEVRTLIMDEANKSKYSTHPRADKMYFDWRDRYWWSGMKKDITEYSAHFLPMREDYKMDRLARLYLNEIVARHGVPILIISDRDSRFTSRFWQTMQEALGTRLDMSTAYHPQTDGHSERTIQTFYHSSVRCAPFEALYGRKYRSPIIWAEVGEGQLIGPELVQETTEKISQIKDRLKATRDRQKSHTDKRRKPLEFSVGDYVLLKVSPWKGVIRFGKNGKLVPRFVGPF
ncbi:putative reverse transcriptase domain-containing protein, partial [Tanacetum coccineum]